MSIKCNQCGKPTTKLESWISTYASCGDINKMYEIIRPVIDAIVDEHKSKDRMMHNLYVCDYKHISATFINDPKDVDYVYAGANSYITNLYYHVRGVFLTYNSDRRYYINILINEPDVPRRFNIDHRYFNADSISTILDIAAIGHITDKATLYSRVDSIPIINKE